MTNIVISDLGAVVELSTEEQAEIQGGRANLNNIFGRRFSPMLMAPVDGGRGPGDPGSSDDSLYPGLGNQADNETPLRLRAR
jgi:hypothetical protein